MNMAASNRSAARGLTPIGDHLPTPGISDSSSGSVTRKSPTSSTASETTGSPSPARTGASSTGLRASETGSARPTTLIEAQALLAPDAPAVSEEDFSIERGPALLVRLFFETVFAGLPEGERGVTAMLFHECNHDRIVSWLAELLEVDRGPGGAGAVVGLAQPLELHRPGNETGLAAGQYPVDAGEVEFVARADNRLD